MNVKLSQKGWVVIPASLREKYGLKPGANLQVVDYGGVLAIVPGFKNAVKEGAGILKGGVSLTGAIIDEHRQELNRDK
jgi:AbrB family looped-hinge helix DNA binding protein